MRNLFGLAPRHASRGKHKKYVEDQMTITSSAARSWGRRHHARRHARAGSKHADDTCTAVHSSSMVGITVGTYGSSSNSHKTHGDNILAPLHTLLRWLMLRRNISTVSEPNMVVLVLTTMYYYVLLSISMPPPDRNSTVTCCFLGRYLGR